MLVYKWKIKPTRYVTETWEDNSVYTCDLPSRCEWRYQQLQVIVFFVVFRPCMCTCLCVAHQRKRQARRKTHIWPTDACKLTKKRASPSASWMCRVTNRVHIAWTQTGRHSILI